MTDDDKAWVRSWPMLLVAALLMIGGAYGYFRVEDNIASAALMGAGLVLVGGWFAVEVYRLDRKVAKKVEEVRDDNADSG